MSQLESSINLYLIVLFLSTLQFIKITRNFIQSRIIYIFLKFKYKLFHSIKTFYNILVIIIIILLLAFNLHHLITNLFKNNFTSALLSHRPNKHNIFLQFLKLFNYSLHATQLHEKFNNSAQKNLTIQIKCTILQFRQTSNKRHLK